MVAVPPRASVNQVARAHDALVITVQVLEHLLRGPRERDPEKLDEIFHVRVCEHSLELLQGQRAAPVRVRGREERGDLPDEIEALNLTNATPVQTLGRLGCPLSARGICL